MREFLKGLELDKETIDSIMAEHGKTTQVLREQIEELKTENGSLKESSKLTDEERTELETYRKEKEEAKAKSEDDALTARIEKTFGEKEFINDLTKKALILEMKGAINNEENIGKSDSEIFEALVKDQENLFVNPNKPADIPPMGNGTAESTSEQTPMFW